MKIEAIALREIHMRLKAPFETSFGIVQNRRILLVEIIVDGVSGWGEVTAGETPGYNAETIEPCGTCFPISSLLPSSAKTYWTLPNFLL